MVDFSVGVSFRKGFTQIGEILSKNHSTIVSFLGGSVLSRNEGMNHFMFGLVKKVLMDIQVTWPLATVSTYLRHERRKFKVYASILHFHPFPIKTGMWNVKHWWTFGVHVKCAKEFWKVKVWRHPSGVLSKIIPCTIWLLQLQANSLPSKVHLIWWDGAKVEDHEDRKHIDFFTYYLSYFSVISPDDTSCYI